MVSNPKLKICEFFLSGYHISLKVPASEKVLVYENPDRSFTVNENEKLGARYLRLRVLLPGATFGL